MYNVYDEQAKEELKDDLIREEMHKARERVIEILVSSKMHVLFCEEIALMIAHGFFESFEPAVKLTEEFNFSKMDMLAVLEEFDFFKEEFLEEAEKQFDFEDL